MLSWPYGARAARRRFRCRSSRGLAARGPVESSWDRRLPRRTEGHAVTVDSPESRGEMSPPRLTRHPDGITAIDAEYVRPGFAAVHVIERAGRAAFVDTGTTPGVPRLLAALEILGIAREAVDYLLLTHVHLDHAGGA